MDDAHSASRDVVRPVVIDSPKRLFLLIPTELDDEVCWTLPTVPMRPGETIRGAASPRLRRIVHLPPLRISPLIGRLSRRDGAEGVQYVVVVRPAAETGRRLCGSLSLRKLAGGRRPNCGQTERSSSPLNCWTSWMATGAGGCRTEKFRSSKRLTPTLATP